MVIGVKTISGLIGISGSTSVSGSIGAGQPPVGFTGRIFGVTKRPYTAGGEDNTPSTQGVYSSIGLTTATQGNIQNITDNNDGSFTNPNSSSVTLNGAIIMYGGNTSPYRWKVGVGTDNSGSLVIEDDNSGLITMSNNFSSPYYHAYSLTLDAGKTVTPMLVNYTGTAITYTTTSFTHFVWN